MVKTPASRSDATWLGIQHGAESLCSSLANLRGTQHVSGLTVTNARYTAARLRSLSYLSNFVCGDLALTLF